MLNFCQGSSWTLQNFKRNLRENLVALVGASLTSQVIKVTPILPEILTSCPYNCWPLLLRMSVLNWWNEKCSLETILLIAIEKWKKRNEKKIFIYQKSSKKA